MKLTDGEKNDRDDAVSSGGGGGGGGDGGGGEGYYAQKFSRLYTAFIATTSATQVMPQ